MSQPTVARSADHDDVVEVLATAFEHDPVFSALLPDAGSRPARLRRFFTVDAGPWALDLGTSWILRDGVDPIGAAVILPSRQRHNPAANHPATLLEYVSVFGRHSLRARGYLKAVEAAHPMEEHLYLPFIGAARPGRGAGSILLSAMTRAADAAGLPLYLEASSDTSARLYRRHGFVDTGTLEIPGIPPVRPMWREPSDS